MPAVRSCKIPRSCEIPISHAASRESNPTNGAAGQSTQAGGDSREGGCEKGISHQPIPSVVLTQAEHHRMTKALLNALPKGISHKRTEVWQAYQNVERDFPDWSSSIEHYFR